MTASTLLESTAVRTRLLDSVPPPCTHVAATGSGPFREDEFGALLRAHGVDLDPIEPSTRVLVLGHDDWDEQAVERLLRHGPGDDLKVYSQEMFMFEWTSVEQPFVDSRVIEEAAGRHPARGLLASLGIEWAGAVQSLEEERARADTQSCPSIALLHAMGYRPGAAGMNAVARRAVLGEILYAESLPDPDAPDRALDWGRPWSETRLEKMAGAMAAAIRTERRRKAVSREALDAWEADLRWLRDRFYDGKCRFHWPWTWTW